MRRLMACGALLSGCVCLAARSPLSAAPPPPLGPVALAAALRDASTAASAAGLNLNPDQLYYFAAQSNVSLSAALADWWASVAAGTVLPQAPPSAIPIGVEATAPAAALTSCALDSNGPLLLGPGQWNSVHVYNTAGGVRRFYLILPSPALVTQGSSIGTIMAFHGGAEYANNFLMETSYDRAGPQAGFAVIAPDGLPGMLGVGGQWRLQNDIGDGLGDVTPNVDDMRFARDAFLCASTVLVAAEPRLNGASLDPHVLATGWSIGAKFAARLTCATQSATYAPLVVSALAAASGLQADADRPCGSGVPMVLFQGSADQMVPYCSRNLALEPFSYAATAPELAVWRDVYNGHVGGEAARTTSCYGGETLYQFAGRQPGGPPVSLFWRNGGGHEWPTTLDGCPASGATAVAVALYKAVRRAGSAGLELNWSPCLALQAGACAAGTQLPCNSLGDQLYGAVANSF